MLLTGFLIIAAFSVFAFISKGKTKNGTVDKASASEGIQFTEANWNKALAEAKSQHKLIFLDAYASWCGPCKMLKNKTFPNKEAGDFFNKNFINVAIDMEKGEGPSLREKYGVTAYPTLIIADGDGNIITYTQGYVNPKQLIEFGNFGLNKMKK